MTRVSGAEMHALARDLWPICRSITGDGVRETHERLRAWIPLETHEVPSGTRVFDWTVPNEWNLRDAYVVGPSGARVIDIANHTLHVLGYSTPVDARMTRAELDAHLYSLPELPDAIPYVTSYYRERWGFCLTDHVRKSLPEGEYRVVIDSTLAPGSLTYSDLVIPGESEEEIFFSTYTCHPSMASNELSGPIVAAALARYVLAAPRRYTYRFVFAPETIGSITYLARHLEHLQKQVVAGWVLTCLGDERTYGFMPSRRGDTLADRVSRHVLRHHAPEAEHHSFLQRGSDERQYCSPRVDLPVASIMRSKYGTYPEYHTSLDDLSFMTAEGLDGSLEAYIRVVDCLEANHTYRATLPCEPQLGRRGLYPDLSTRASGLSVRRLTNILAYADGSLDAVALAETIESPLWECESTIETLLEHELLEVLA